MSNLKNTTINNITVNNDVNCLSTTSARNTAHVSAQPNISSSYTTTGVIDFTNTITLIKDFNKTGGRFTAMYSGLYMITFLNISNNNGSTNRTYIRVNGARISQARGEGTPTYPMVNAMHTAYLNVGDYIDLDHGDGMIYLTTTYTSFTVHRIY